MSRLNNQDDLFVPWDDFSATQLENVENFAVSKTNSNLNDENNVDIPNSFLLNCSKVTLDDFLDELLGLPTKSTPKVRAPLGDISNTRQQKHNTSIKEKEQKKQPTPNLTRMDSIDDSIWADFDTDLLSLIDVESKKSNDPILPNEKKNTTSIPSKNVTPVNEKTSIDDKFLLKQQNDKALCHGFTTARGTALPPPSKEAKLKATRLLQTVGKGDNIELSLSVDENLFLPLNEPKEDVSPIDKERDQSDSSLFENNDLSPTSIYTPVYKLEPIIKDDDDDCASISSYEDVFLPLSFKYKPLPPPGASQPKPSTSDIKLPLSPSIVQNELSPVSEPSIEQIIPGSTDDLGLPPISVDESLFLPQVTEDGHVIKELPTPTGPAAGFQSAKLIKSVHTPKENHNYSHSHINNTNIPETPKPIITPVESSSTNIPKEPCTSSFTTAAGKKLEEPSLEGVQRATALFDSSKKPNKHDAVINEYGGFKTGYSNKSFDISPQAKRKAILVLDEIDEEVKRKKVRVATDKSQKDFGSFVSSELQLQGTFKGLPKASFTTASGKELGEPCLEDIQRATALFDSSKKPNKHDAVINEYGGFKTGNSNKSFDISSQAKRKAISVLDEIDEEVKCKKIRVAANKSQKGLEPFQMENTSIASPELQLQGTSKGPPKASFATASGKKLGEPSLEGIQRATALFDSSKKPNKHDAVINEYGGFKTGNSNKSFDISSQAKRKAISVLNEVNKEVESKDIRLTPPLDIINTPNGIGKRVSASKYIPKSFDNDTSKLQQVQMKDSTKNELSSDSITSRKDSAESHNATATDLKSPTINAVVPNKPSTSMFPKRNINRAASIQTKNKPFKSPIIKSNIELTKAAVNNRSSLKAKLTPVFNLEVPDFRFKLYTLGAPGTFTKSQLIADNIPISVINMTISTAKRYVFDGNWGPKEALRDMIEAGALPRRVTIEWVENHYVLILWKIACLIRSYNAFMDRWKPQAILEQLLYRYEREINMGHRPVLRRILEKDDLPVKHMILMITDIVEIRSSIQYNTSSKYRLQLSDGWYQVPACIDLRIEKAIMKKKLKIGSKISVCGASIIGDNEGINPLENTDNSTMLSITANSSLPARWHTKLGYHPRKFIIRGLPSIFYDGGTVTAIDIVVCRKFPILYSETLPNGTIVTRNAKEEEEERRIALGYDSYGVRQHKSGSKNDAPVERRVSGYFKIRICDHIAPLNQEWATLLLSNANELNHMDISEGNRYKIFFVVPYHPKNKKYPGLDMKTTRVTRWEPAPTLNLLNSYTVRSLTKCGDIHRKDSSSDFDLVVLVLQTGPSTLEVLNGRKLWKQTLLVSDDSQNICQINLRLPMNPFPDIKGTVLGLLNLRFETYDSKFDITCLKATDESESVSKVSAAAEYVQKGMLNLKRWVNDYPDEVQRLHNRVEKMQ